MAFTSIYQVVAYIALNGSEESMRLTNLNAIRFYCSSHSRDINLMLENLRNSDLYWSIFYDQMAESPVDNLNYTIFDRAVQEIMLELSVMSGTIRGMQPCQNL